MNCIRRREHLISGNRPGTRPMPPRPASSANGRTDSPAFSAAASLTNSDKGGGGGGSLVLSRREGQSILIGDHIRVVIAKVSGDQVRLAVQAPRELAIDREEVRRQSLRV